jgi:hypothetical protein
MEQETLEKAEKDSRSGQEVNNSPAGLFWGQFVSLSISIPLLRHRRLYAGQQILGALFSTRSQAMQTSTSKRMV